MHSHIEASILEPILGGGGGAYTWALLGHGPINCADIVGKHFGSAWTWSNQLNPYWGFTLGLSMDQ